MDDYAIHGRDLETVRKGLQVLEEALSGLGLRLSSTKTRVGASAMQVFTNARLEVASGEVYGEAELAPDQANAFLKICDEILDAPWAASVRDVSFVVTRLKRHPELLDQTRWVKGVRWMPHAAEHLARLARHDASFRAALEDQLPAIIGTAWAGQAWAQVKLMGVWPSAPRPMLPLLRTHLAETIQTHPATTPTLAYLLADELPLSELRELAMCSNDWLSHRALWLCAGRAGASTSWLDKQLARFEVHSVLRAAWEARGHALFERARDEDPRERSPV
ncbi:hypothetical protein DB30_02708 [Enhygromyxa salina]|uniref:Reverse transcriptase domain-containing protein n=1 Tax=Enhygromyxa salina TaxID=215803 RepID=A0A0C2DID5_9BACT|nr:hypothetical protein [Enhygromyxa salina]KIG19427.1 hypothetical protein DB30_02708 [Enhygromyxa salina]